MDSIQSSSVADLIHFVATRFEANSDIKLENFLSGCSHFSKRILRTKFKDIPNVKDAIRECFDLVEEGKSTKVIIPPNFSFPDPRKHISKPKLFTRRLQNVQGMEVWISNDPNAINKMLSDMGLNVVGFDIEWAPVFMKEMLAKPAMVQIANETMCFLIRLCQCSTFPVALKDILERDDIQKVGKGIAGDAKLMKQSYGIEMRGLIELHGRRPGSNSLKALAKNMLGLKIDVKKMKKLAMTDWESEYLGKKALAYAAFDAIVSRKLFFIIGGKETTMKVRKKKKKYRKKRKTKL
jgi:hypothetical protein